MEQFLLHVRVMMMIILFFIINIYNTYNLSMRLNINMFMRSPRSRLTGRRHGRQLFPQVSAHRESQRTDRQNRKGNKWKSKSKQLRPQWLLNCLGVISLQIKQLRSSFYRLCAFVAMWCNTAAPSVLSSEGKLVTDGKWCLQHHSVVCVCDELRE